jgi:ABC-2 type transport system permease protein
MGIVAVQLSVYPAMKTQTGVDDIWDKMPEAMQAMFGVSGGLDFTSGAGYLRGEVFGFTLPLLFLVLGIGAGAAAVAGDEEQGALGLVLAQPVRRSHVVIERFAAIVCSVGVVAGSVLATIVVGGALVGLHVGLSAVVAGVASTALLSFLFGALALAVGAVTGRRGTALSVAAGLAVFAYLCDSLATLTDVLKPLQVVSPFHWAPPGTLIAGGSPWGLGWLAVGTTVLVAVAAWALERRDIH